MVLVWTLELRLPLLHRHVHGKGEKVLLYREEGHVQSTLEHYLPPSNLFVTLLKYFDFVLLVLLE